MDSTPDNMNERDIEYQRSLVVLQEFLKGHSARPKYAATPGVKDLAKEYEMPGNPKRLKYQWNGNKFQSQVRYRSPCSHALYEILIHFTLFSRCRKS